MNGLLKQAKIFGKSTDMGIIPYMSEEGAEKAYKRMHKAKAKEEPSSLAKTMLVGAGSGALIGAAGEGLGSVYGLSPSKNKLKAPVAGAVIGAGLGALARYLDKRKINKSKEILNKGEEEFKTHLKQEVSNYKKRKESLEAAAEFNRNIQKAQRVARAIQGLHDDPYRPRYRSIDPGYYPANRRKKKKEEEEEPEFRTRTFAAKSGIGRIKPTGAGRVSFRKNRPKYS